MGEDRYRRGPEVGVLLTSGAPARDGAPARILYGRRKGRPLRPGQQALFETLLPRIEVRAEALRSGFDPAPLFGAPRRPVWLEIGFGAGEHLAAQAERHPEIGFIGCEPFVNGVARLLAAIDAGGLANVRIFRDDARLLLAALGEATLARAFALYPDPWPKTRHHKRRVIAADTVGHLARTLSDGAELRVATDDPGYKGWILHHVLAGGDFAWEARRPQDWRERPEGWPATRYEEKAVAAGRRPSYFLFRRCPRQGIQSS